MQYHDILLTKVLVWACSWSSSSAEDFNDRFRVNWTGDDPVTVREDSEVQLTNLTLITIDQSLFFTVDIRVRS